MLFNCFLCICVYNIEPPPKTATRFFFLFLLYCYLPFSPNFCYFNSFGTFYLTKLAHFFIQNLQFTSTAVYKCGTHHTVLASTEFLLISRLSWVLLNSPVRGVYNCFSLIILYIPSRSSVKHYRERFFKHIKNILCSGMTLDLPEV